MRVRLAAGRSKAPNSAMTNRGYTLNERTYASSRQTRPTQAIVRRLNRSRWGDRANLSLGVRQQECVVCVRLKAGGTKNVRIQLSQTDFSDLPPFGVPTRSSPTAQQP